MAAGGPDDRLMAQVARRGDDRVRGHIIAAHESPQGVPPHAVQGLRRPREGPAQRVVRPERLVDQFLHVLMRIIQAGGDLLLDHLAFPGDVGRGHARIQQHVHQHLEQVRQPLVRRFREEAGALLAGEGVEIAADAFDGPGNLLGRPAPGAFEEHVLDEMSHAIDRGRLVASPHAHPQTHAGAGHLRGRGGDDDQAGRVPGYLRLVTPHSSRQSGSRPQSAGIPGWCGRPRAGRP